MRFELAYWDRTQSLDVPDRNLLGALNPNDRHGLELAPADIERLRSGLRDFAAGARSLLVVVNDYTRPTPNEEILKIIEPELKGKDVWFVMACGSHVKPTGDQFRQVFGAFYEPYRERILVHDGKDKTRLKFLGKTSRGTEAWVNDMVWMADRIVTINSVEPHYFAGYTGGRKSILPGISGYETITQNHRLALVPEACTLALQGNPVHEDMTEVAKMVPWAIFSIQVLIDNRHRLCGIHSGDIFKSFEEAIPDANRIFCVPIREKADIAVAVSASPYDVDFYQQQKALENGRLGLKDGGILIGVSACRAGTGDDTFIRLLSSVKTPGEAIERIWANFVLGYHKSAKLAGMMVTCEIWNVTPLADELVRSVFMTPFRDVQSALDAALAKKGPGARVIVLPDASLTVPLCSIAKEKE